MPSLNSAESMQLEAPAIAALGPCVWEVPEVETEKLFNHVGGELLDAKLHHPALKGDTSQRLLTSTQRGSESIACI